MTHMTQQSNPNRPFDPSIRSILFALIVGVALLSRFAVLGDRVMSHDEVNHVVPSYELYQGKGYVHSPVTHGPFQFHIVALTYFLFGDNDTTSRIPAALFSVSAVLFVLIAFPRYLGRNGALIAGALFTISPFMMFYGRYTRNEAFIELIGVVLLYGILRYLEKGDRLGMMLVTLSTALHFIVKETAFIYTAQALIFLFLMFLFETRQVMKGRPAAYNRFLSLMVIAILSISLVLGTGIVKARMENASNANQTAITSENQSISGQSGSGSNSDEARRLSSPELIILVVAGVLGLAGLWTLSKVLGWNGIKQMRSFSLLLLIGTLILPMLSPFPISLLGWDPLDYSNTAAVLRTGAFVGLFFFVAGAIGLWWNPGLWLKNALIFYSLFTVFYTTFFTNPNGLLTGIVGSLGYWLSQQAFERGTQPLYYYALIQMPVYEFLAGFGTLLATFFGIRYHRLIPFSGRSPAFSSDQQPVVFPLPVAGEERIGEKAAPPANIEEISPGRLEVGDNFSNPGPHPSPVLGLLLFWAATSLAAFSLAGERMPWLTVHIALPCLLASGWGLGYLVDTTDWKIIFQKKGVLALLILPVFIASLSNLFATLFGANSPFQGNSSEQLQTTGRFLVSFIATGVSLAGLFHLLRSWPTGNFMRLVTTFFTLLLVILTARAAYRASFIYDDYAFEYLVYAHASPASKEVLQQVKMISRQTVGENAIRIAYGGDALYPYWWYLRDFPNSHYFGTKPTRELRADSVIIVGDDLFDQMDPIVRDDYIQFEYVRLWWPNQDYWSLSWGRIWEVISNSQMRSAIFQIWLNRDYRTYASLTNQAAQFNPETWEPAERMRVYIRKDAVAKIWSLGATPTSTESEQVDPYEKLLADLEPVQVIGSAGSESGQFLAPRGIKIASDGSLYIADSRNHRIQHLSQDGSVLQVWGSFADANAGEAPGGTFNEPWDVAIGNDGSVYVADTWNHRVQKFSATGSFLKMWGYFGQGEQPDAFWGPRGLAVDAQGRIFVVDTGNKRVVVFDPDGNFITQFGSAGLQLGQMDEPVGITVDEQGNAYITDTWNQRIQVFSPTNQAGTVYQFNRSWEIQGWYGQSLENKPFIAVNPVTENILVTDPESLRVLEFNNSGTFIRGWSNFSTDPNAGFGLISGITIDNSGQVWVTDASNCRIYQFR